MCPGCLSIVAIYSKSNEYHGHTHPLAHEEGVAKEDN